MTLDNGKSELVYQGRRAQRADSRQRRKAILEGTLRLIVKEGIRGIRHRAVAKEAEVPLAATTYYFKDLNDLISDAFTYFVEKNIDETRSLQEESFAAVRQLPKEQLHSAEGRRQLTQQLTRFVLAHIRTQVASRDNRIIELAFKNEALRNPQLTRAVRMASQSIENLIVEFFELLQLADPLAAAQIVYGTILNLEFQILNGAIAVDSPLLERAVSLMVKRLIPAQTVAPAVQTARPQFA
ncbi:TetR/AcrR family transcriptional regulator [Microbulbifer agarilyticus]|uniref:TetR/AcrR family transcriptional regulator n=1 Tax=Microbulbifer agarilyticus TaxID=260552 RepID=UPI001C983877|nr:TetR/AcrR family transcriptional regulator [Microbulbifer agarilyticus]MBY6212464.1 TetR/AcrR family transcriptional regulator [Microbulbifer agarilyticus]MCA0894081.1 TetR/AcrR family transcriptional regulator [Microbulbifer agarilyticus]